jgi:hypothetical protein
MQFLDKGIVSGIGWVKLNLVFGGKNERPDFQKVVCLLHL